MRLADVVERVEDAALQEREMALDRIGVRKTAVLAVFLCPVNPAAVTGELIADARIDRAVVGHNVRLAAGVLDDDRAQVLGRDVGDGKAGGFAVALDQRDDRHLAAGAAADTLALPGVLVALFAADIGFV